MNIWTLIIETTDQWDDEVVKHAGRIFDVYVYDDDVNVYPASMTKCVEAYFVETWIENKNWDQLPMDIMHAIEETEALSRFEIKYIPRYNVEASEDLTNLFSLPSGRMGKRPVDGFDMDRVQEEEDPMDIVIQAVREGGI